LAIVVTTIVLFAAIFALSISFEVPGGGFVALYVLPIALVSFELGRRAGMLAAALALSLVLARAGVTGAETGPVSLVLRGVVFFSVGILVGEMAHRLRALARANQESATHFELSRDMLATADLEANLLRVNGAWEQTLGFRRDEVEGRSLAELVHPDDLEQAWAEARRIRDGGGTHAFTFRCRTKDGRWRWLEWSSRLDRDAQVVYAVARDVTDRVLETQRVNRGIDLSPVGIAVVGVAGEEANRVLRVNAKLAEIVGRPADEVVGIDSLVELAHPDDVHALTEALAGLRAGDVDTLSTECRIVRPDGESVWVELTTGIVRDTDGAPIFRISYVLDVADRKRAEERLRYLADHDMLAGTVNRRRFEADLARELDQGEGGALLILDLDGFKRVNDTLGHATGDSVISRVGNALTRRLRGDLDVVGRVGGDEFAVLVRRVGADQARIVAEDLRRAILSELGDDAAPEVRAITASVGLAAFLPGADIDADELLHLADLAMYQAKEAGGNRVVSAVAREMTQPRRAG
jgi:diguanylate cyclase (GGDEF)-like protein/PAS domain S-box-containing protein